MAWFCEGIVVFFSFDNYEVLVCDSSVVFGERVLGDFDVTAF